MPWIKSPMENLPESKSPTGRILTATTMKNLLHLPKILGPLCAALLFALVAAAPAADSNAPATAAESQVLAGNASTITPPLPPVPDGHPFQQAGWNPGEFVPLLVPIAFFGTVVSLVALGLFAAHRKNLLLHGTIRAMIEKGQPIPPELLKPQEAARRPGNDLRKGLVLSAVGIALLLLFSTLHGLPAAIAALGFIPLCMGIAFIIAWKIESKAKNGQG